MGGLVVERFKKSAAVGVEPTADYENQSSKNGPSNHSPIDGDQLN
jgi:hypothetical protein